MSGWRAVRGRLRARLKCLTLSLSAAAAATGERSAAPKGIRSEQSLPGTHSHGEITSTNWLGTGLTPATCLSTAA